MEYGSDAAAQAAYITSALADISGANDETIDYYNRVIVDGGNIISIDNIDSAISHAKTNSYLSNVKGWFSADFGFKNAGSNKVSALYDLSDNDNDATQSGDAYRPYWTDNILNSLPIIRFAGNASWLDYVDGCVASNHSIIYIAIRRGAGSNDGYAPDFGYKTATNSNIGAVHYIKSNLTGASYPCYDSGYYDGLGSYAVDTPFIGALVKPYSGTWYFYKNGSQEGTSSGTNPGNATGLFFAGQWSPSRGAQIDIAECIILDSAVDATTRQAIESYLNSKWEIY